MTRWRSSAGAWLRRTRSSRSLGTSRPSAPARRQIESLIAEGFAAHSSSSSTATSMSLSRRAVPRARLPCSQARRTEESPRRACARRSLEASNVVVAGGHGHGISRSDTLSVPRRDRGQPRISIVRSRRKGARAVLRARPGQSRRHAKGVNGGYTQSDVLEFAKTLTGWTHGGISTPRALEIDDVMPRTLRMPSSHVGRSLTDGLCDADRRRPRRVRRPAAAPLVTAASTSITLSRPFVP